MLYSTHNQVLHLIKILVLHTLVIPLLGTLEIDANVVQKEIYIQINTGSIVQETNEKYLSIGLDTGLVRHKWNGFNFSSEKLMTLSEALVPTFARLGGTDADFLVFNATAEVDHHDNSIFTGVTDQPPKPFVMTGKEWDNINHFSANMRWNLIFDLNVMIRTSDNVWNPTNAKQLLDYSQQRWYNMDFELGNEPTDFKKLFGKALDPTVLGKDFIKLKSILKQGGWSSSLLIGPSINNPKNERIKDFLNEFLQEAGSVVNAVTFHHYYLNGRTAVLANFLDPKILDSLGPFIGDVIDVVNRSATGRHIWIGETATAFGGGAPGLSDTYVAGFMWLDKLGLAARMGVKVVIRQSFFGGNYALLDQNLNPNPDYWLSLLYKILVASKVLEVIRPNVTQHEKVRMYAHCTNVERTSYPMGSVTLYALNVDVQSAVISTEFFSSSSIDEYLLTPGEAGNLTSKFVKVNGETIVMPSDKQLPVFVPRILKPRTPINLPGQTFGFWVFPYARAKICF